MHVENLVLPAKMVQSVKHNFYVRIFTLFSPEKSQRGKHNFCVRIVLVSHLSTREAEVSCRGSTVAAGEVEIHGDPFSDLALKGRITKMRKTSTIEE